jgi:hypothetical protein
LLIFGNFFIKDQHKTWLTRRLSAKAVSYHLLQASLNAEIPDELDPAAIFQAKQNSFDDGLSNFAANELF